MRGGRGRCEGRDPSVGTEGIGEGGPLRGYEESCEGGPPFGNERSCEEGTPPVGTRADVRGDPQGSCGGRLGASLAAGASW